MVFSHNLFNERRFPKRGGLSGIMSTQTDRVRSLMGTVPVVDMHSDYAIELYRRESDGVAMRPGARPPRLRACVLRGGCHHRDPMRLRPPKPKEQGQEA